MSCGIALFYYSLKQSLSLASELRSVFILRMYKTLGAVGTHNTLYAVGTHKTLYAVGTHKTLYAVGNHKTLCAVGTGHPQNTVRRGTHKTLYAVGTHKTLYAVGTHKTLYAVGTHKTLWEKFIEAHRGELFTWYKNFFISSMSIPTLLHTQYLILL